VYKLESLFVASGGQELLIDDRPYYLEGELENRVILSVPEDTSRAAVERIQKSAQALLGKPCLVTTHNVEFMRVRKLSAAEAAQVIKRGEEQTAAALKRLEAEVAAETNTKVENTDATMRDGSGPRDGVHGDSGDNDAGTSAAPTQTGVGKAEVSPDGEGQQKGVAGDPDDGRRPA
jgi:cobalamin biosynthesis Mg chelatase CobN